jgi:transmembrane 9 superfamily protein 2/4
VTFTVFFVLNLFVWGQKSSGAVPFTTLLALLTLWLGISAPLVYLGSFFAFKKDAIKPPLRVNNIPRMLPPDDKRQFFTTPMFLAPACGVIVFSNVYFEVYYIVESVWMHQFYYMFGILAIIFSLLIITSVEMTILMTYFQLCAEDYHWWWNSFFYGASVSFYVAGYSVFFFLYRLDITNFVSGLLFFGYTFLACFALFMMVSHTTVTPRP